MFFNVKDIIELVFYHFKVISIIYICKLSSVSTLLEMHIFESLVYIGI